MLRNILLIAIPAAVAALSVATSSHCSKGCNCSESTAVCDTLDLEPFGAHVFSLKISHPKVPLILKGQPFHVRGLENVNSITIENATILEIGKSAFAGIPQLTSFSIVSSNIPRISNPLAFTAATRLRTLRITNSTLRTFESVASESLQELDLSGCELTAVSESSFAKLPYLTYINLANNKISEIDPAAFYSLQDLQDVVLSNNNVSYVDPNLFAKNTEFVSLNLNNNPLKRLELNFVSDLEKLELKSCQLDQFSSNLSKDLYLLNYLDLSGNKINLSVHSFERMEDLEYIDLSDNELSSLDPHIFRSNYKLQKIILDNNNFTSLPKFVCQYDNFETYFFSCKNCGLTSLPLDSFKHFPALVVLNLSNNRLSGANLTAAQYLTSLIELDLSYNNISAVNPAAFLNSSALDKLNLAGNPLASLDVNLFLHNRVLRSLDVSSCKLRQLWKQPVKRNITCLRHLNAANNSISLISPAVLQVTPLLEVLDISNNPLECDQNLREAITWLTVNEVSPASATPTWKTHESMVNAVQFEISGDQASSWKNMAKERCADEVFLDSFEVEEEVLIPSKPSAKPLEGEDEDPFFLRDNKTDDKEDEYDEDMYDYQYDDDEPTKANDLQGLVKDDQSEIDISELAFESTRLRKQSRSHYSFLWPTLVFVFTALSVLVIAANIMLLMLRTRMVPRHVNLPHIKIPQWNSSGKLKKHSGSVYQQLSEDRSGPCTPIITRKDHVPTHSSSPKSVV